MSKILILISCSNKKSTENKEHFKNSVVDHLSQSGHLLFSARKKIKKLIQEGKVVDRELKEGNRKDREENENLINGPDFGGEENKLVYLPAYKRYRGRFFSKLKDSDWENAKKNGYHILILSGLYGFVHFEDSIQDYNCHLTDIILSEEEIESGTLREKLWQRVLTEVLKEYIKTHAIELVLDLLSEESYQFAIEWEEIEKLGIKILHRIFEKEHGPEFLPNLALFLKNDILPLPSEKILSNELKSGIFISRPYFENGDRIIFEEKIGMIRNSIVKREGIEEYEPILKEKFDFYWEELSDVEKYQLKEGEELFEKKYLKGEGFVIPIIFSWWAAYEGVRKRFLRKLKESNRIIEKLTEGRFDIEEKLTPSHTELILSPSVSPSVAEKYFPKGKKEVYKEIREFLGKKVKDQTLFFLFKKNGHAYKVRKIRNRNKNPNYQKAKEDLEEFRKIFFDKENSPLIAYLKLIREISK